MTRSARFRRDSFAGDLLNILFFAPVFRETYEASRRNPAKVRNLDIFMTLHAIFDAASLSSVRERSSKPSAVDVR